MFTYLLDLDELNITSGRYQLDSSVRAAETDRPLTCALTAQRLVVVSGDFAHLMQSEYFNCINPFQKLLYNVTRDFAQLFNRTRC